VRAVGQEVSIYGTKLAASPGLCGSGERLRKAVCAQTGAALSYTALECVCPTDEALASFAVSPVTALGWYQHLLLM